MSGGFRLLSRQRGNHAAGFFYFTELQRVPHDLPADFDLRPRLAPKNTESLVFFMKR